jgi:hypothetical protein
VGALVVIWSLWLCINDKVFNDKNYSLLQVIYRCTTILHLWSPLQRVENHDLFTEVCIRLERLQRGILFPHMGGCIIYELDLHLLLTRSTLTRFDMYFVYFRLVGFFETCQKGWV